MLAKDVAAGGTREVAAHRKPRGKTTRPECKLLTARCLACVQGASSTLLKRDGGGGNGLFDLFSHLCPGTTVP